MKRKRIFLACLLLIAVASLSGCDVNARNLLNSSQEKDKFVRVEIVFTDEQKLVTYLKDLGLESDARIYVGGASTNNFYDARGNIIGAFNYQRVLYIKILPEGEGDNNRGD
jgi:hypothetical protein